MGDEAWNGGEPQKPRKSFEQEFRDLLAADDFEPFHIVMNSGERFVVSSPYSMSIGETVFVVYTRESTSRLRTSAISHIDVPEVR